MPGLLIIFGILYAIELLFYSFAAHRARRTKGGAHTPEKRPKVSVIVAARDEEDNLAACLESLASLDYPVDLIDVIVVNDQSVDSTPEIIDGFVDRYPHFRRLDAVANHDMRGKPNALSQGIDTATGEFIFLTDADCSVPPTWINGTLKYFDEKTGIIGGVTLISRTERLLAGIQALDWSFLLTVGAGAATIHRPLACLGNNLAFRKDAYNDAGGYRKIGFSVTEDYALFKAISSNKKWHYRYPMDRKTLVETLPVKTLKQVYAQRKRWATGGKDTGIFGIVTLAPGFLFHWALILSLLLAPGIFPLFLLFKLIMDCMFVAPTLKFYGKIAHLKFILYFEIYYMIYVAILPFSVYLGKAVTWKGRKY